MARMAAVNVAQGTTLNAARGAFAAPLAETPEQKTQKLITMLKSANCTQTYQKPSERYDVSWQSNWQVGKL